MDNPTKADRIFDLLPKYFNARANENWSSLISAIGAEDERLAKLAEEVRKQFFVKTANRPYLDRLAANNNLQRPRFVGMSDTDFRKFIPILSYQPKQVKRIIDEMLDLFFLKDATTAFLSTGLYEPFVLKDTWGLDITVDAQNQEHVVFRTSDFTDISAATANEVVAAYNRQAKYSYAITYYDSTTKQTYVRIFSNTIGAQGSMAITGGLANIAFELNGFLSELGPGNNTQWIVTKVGNTVTFTYNAGIQPGVESLQPGDIFFCDLSGNEGSFVITKVDIKLRNFTFENLLATAGTFTQTNSKQTKWMRPVYVTSFARRRRALVWETTVGAISIEMPATPPIVNREAKGGMHVNGEFGIVTEVNSPTSLTVNDTEGFPTEGQFIIEPIEAITARLKGGPSELIATVASNGRVISDFTRYHYTGISGNTLTGITPNLPSTTALDEVTITSLSKSSNIITCVASNDFSAGDTIFIAGSSGIPILTVGDTTIGSSTLNNIGSLTGVSPGQLVIASGVTPGTKVLQVLDPSTIVMSAPATTTLAATAVVFSENTNGPFEVVSANSGQFTIYQVGTSGSASTPGVASKEQLLLAPDSFKIIITTSVSSDITEIKGPYIWQLDAPFTLSADTSTTTTNIVAGKTYKLLVLGSNDIPDGPGYLVLDFGKNNQEGPIKYLYKASENTVAVDTTYTFQQFHDIGASVVAVSKLGPHIPTGQGNEYPPYVTNPPDARKLLQDLIVSVASAGIFIDFIIRYPNQLYGTINVYD
jgi:hypothetical protein